MEAISIYWAPGSNLGRHPPVHVHLRRYHAHASPSRRYGSCGPAVHPDFAVGKSARSKQETQVINFTNLHIQLSIFLHREAGACRPLSPGRKVRSWATIKTEKSVDFPLPLIPSGLSKDQKDKASLQDSGECKVGRSKAPPPVTPFWSGRKAAKQGRSWFNTSPNLAAGHQREIIHQEILSRLKTAGAAAAEENPWGPTISKTDNGPLRAADSPNDMLGNRLAVQDEKWLQSRRGLREVDQHPNNHDKGKKETRRSLLKHSVPPILDRLGFRLPPGILSCGQNGQQAARRVDVILSYEVGYVLDRNYRSVASKEHGMEMLGWHSKNFWKKADGFPTRGQWWTSPKGMTNGKMGRTILERGNPMGFGGHSTSRARWGGRFLEPNADHCASMRSGGTLGASSRMTGSHFHGSGRRLWSLADSLTEPAGNLFKEWLAIVGLVAFVVSGTYAFAISYRYLKTGIRFGKAPGVIAAQDGRLMPSNLSPIGGEELTDDNFVDAIQKRPTFVLFYAPWCPYCQLLDPTWKELGSILSKKGYDVQLARMNVDENPNIADNFKVKKYPTFIFFKDGVAAENGRYLGPRNINSFLKFIDENLQKQCS